METRPAVAPDSDIYTVLIIIATVFVATATIFIAFRSQELFGSWLPLGPTISG